MYNKKQANRLLWEFGFYQKKYFSLTLFVNKYKTQATDFLPLYFACNFTSNNKTLENVSS